MPNPTSRHVIALACAALCNASLATPADPPMPLATPASASATGNDQPDQLTAVIVTAQRRSENLQVVPIAVTVLSGKAIEDTGYRSLTDLQYLVPSLQYDPTQGAAFQIRGVGSRSFDFSNAKSVSVVVDDVVMDAQRANGLIGLSDLQHVDVMMGPQGTLFGKNATSGVIAVTTRQPELNRYSVEAGVSYGQRNDHLYNATLNAPLGESGALRIAAFDQGQDGYGRYTTLDRKLGTVKENGYRAKLLFKPSQDLEVMLANDYQYHWDSNIRTAVSGAPAAVTAAELANGVTPGPNNADTADSSFGETSTEEWGSSLRVRYNLGGNTLTSVTAYRGSTYDSATPADLVPANVYAYVPYNTGNLSTHKYSQELRLASPSGQFVEYLGGLFYNKLKAEQWQLQWATLGAPLVAPDGAPLTQLYALTGAKGQPGNASLFHATSTSAAAFGQLKLNFTPGFSVALGGRYTHDDNGQSLHYITVPSAPITGVNNTFVATSAAPFLSHGSVAGHNFSYRITPQYQLNKDVMAYATYTTGYKPGGVAFVSNFYDPYRPETVKSLELGIKSELLGHRLRLNVDLFVQKFKDFQTSILTSIPGNPTLQAVIGNAGGLRSEGAEVNATWRAAAGLTLNAALTYTAAHYTDYVYNATTDYTGTALTNAPRWSATLGLNHQMPVGQNMVMNSHLDLAARSNQWTVVGQPAYSEIAGYALLNGRITLSPDNSHVEYGLYGRNLLNRGFSTAYQQYGPLGLLRYSSPDAYRTIGAFAKYTF